jgi:hypothetical protein
MLRPRTLGSLNQGWGERHLLTFAKRTRTAPAPSVLRVPCVVGPEDSDYSPGSTGYGRALAQLNIVARWHQTPVAASCASAPDRTPNRFALDAKQVVSSPSASSVASTAERPEWRHRPPSSQDHHPRPDSWHGGPVPLPVRARIADYLCRLVYVAGLGFLAGHLSEAEAWGYALAAAHRIQQTFQSWEDLGASYLMGMTWRRGPDDDLTASYEELMAEPSGPYRIPWGVGLG